MHSSCGHFPASSSAEGHSKGQHSNGTGATGAGRGQANGNGYGNGSGAHGVGLAMQDDSDDVFDCLPLSGWSDDTLIGLPTSYVLYDKFQKLSTNQRSHKAEHQQRASSAKPSGSKKMNGIAPSRLVSSSKGPRRENFRTTTSLRERESERERERHLSNRASQHSRHGANGVHTATGSRVLSSVQAEDEGHEERDGGAAISEWPNSLRIVVPYKLKQKQKGAAAANPNLHSSHGARGLSANSHSEVNNGVNYFGYRSKAAAVSTIPSALRVQQRKSEREKEKEKCAALAKAKLLSNYRNRQYHQKVAENEEPLVISKKNLDLSAPPAQVHGLKQSWRK